MILTRKQTTCTQTKQGAFVNLDNHKVVHPAKAGPHPAPDSSGAKLEPWSHDRCQLCPVAIVQQSLHLRDVDYG